MLMTKIDFKITSVCKRMEDVDKRGDMLVEILRKLKDQYWDGSKKMPLASVWLDGKPYHYRSEFGEAYHPTWNVSTSLEGLRIMMEHWSEFDQSKVVIFYLHFPKLL